jgi:hypothetical protein
VGGDRIVVGYKNDRSALSIQFMQDFHNGFPRFFVQIPRGFIGKDKCRVIDKRAGDSNALLFASR